MRGLQEHWDMKVCTKEEWTLIEVSHACEWQRQVERSRCNEEVDELKYLGSTIQSNGQRGEKELT